VWVCANIWSEAAAAAAAAGSGSVKLRIVRRG